MESTSLIISTLRYLISSPLLAYAAGLDNTEQLDKWERSEATPHQGAVDKLKASYELTMLLTTIDTPTTARGWLQSQNPMLGNVSPARALRDWPLSESLEGIRRAVDDFAENAAAAEPERVVHAFKAGGDLDGALPWLRYLVELDRGRALAEIREVSESAPERLASTLATWRATATARAGGTVGKDGRLTWLARLEALDAPLGTLDAKREIVLDDDALEAIRDALRVLRELDDARTNELTPAFYASAFSNIRMSLEEILSAIGFPPRRQQLGEET
ncbi:hypothetical protein [Sinomonas sp. G460-2]|uniref:hypothetical protein n=1 Tax=Sinomonas sp. G460-2 TaxID=3393464 RepID=UPI0039F01962